MIISPSPTTRCFTDHACHRGSDLPLDRTTGLGAYLTGLHVLDRTTQDYRSRGVLDRTTCTGKASQTKRATPVVSEQRATPRPMRMPGCAADEGVMYAVGVMVMHDIHYECLAVPLITGGLTLTLTVDYRGSTCNRLTVIIA